MIEKPVPEIFVVPFRVLFLCTHNSSRSQMAEGLLRARGGNDFQVFSAGTHPGHVHPLAIKVMAELGIDIGEHAGHYTKEFGVFKNEPPMDLVVTVCEKVAEKCPSFPKAHRRFTGGFLILQTLLALSRSVWRPFGTFVISSQHASISSFRQVGNILRLLKGSSLFIENRGKKRQVYL